MCVFFFYFFFFQAEDGIRDYKVTGVQTCALPICHFRGGYGFVILSLTAEAALLFVAAQAGFLDGPRVLANMALDSWMPHRFSQLSDRLVTKNGIHMMGIAAAASLIYTRGDITTLVVMYSIN